MPEDLSSVRTGLALVAESPEVQRLIRVIDAVQHELSLRDRRLDDLDPTVLALRSIKPLADVEREHIEHAVRLLGNPTQAARALRIAPATVYRKLGEYAQADAEKRRLVRLGARAARRRNEAAPA